MRRFVALLCLSLYFYNLAGFFAFFAVQQMNIRDEIKRTLKEELPREQLVIFAFHTVSLEDGSIPIQWLDEKEFRYAGGMYDIVRKQVSQDTTYLQCINDVQEERLFADLDRHVSRAMGGSANSKFFSFNEIFKDSFSQQVLYCDGLTVIETLGEDAVLIYKSADLKEPFHPPRLLLL